MSVNPLNLCIFNLPETALPSLVPKNRALLAKSVEALDPFPEVGNRQMAKLACELGV